MTRGGVVSKSATKAPRAGIGRGGNRGISTILLARPDSIGAFVADLDVENVSACPAGACDPEFDWRPRGSALVAVLSASRPAGDTPAPVEAPRDLIRARVSPVNVLIRWAPTGAPTTRKAHHHDDRHRRDTHPGPIRRRALGRRGGRHPQGHPPRRGRQRGDRRRAGRYAGPRDPGGPRPAPRLRPLPRAHPDDRHRGHRLLRGGPGPRPGGPPARRPQGSSVPSAPSAAAASPTRSEPEPPPAGRWPRPTPCPWPRPAPAPANRSGCSRPGAAAR